MALVAKAKMDRGELVDDETMIAIVRRAAAAPGCGARVRARRVSADGGAGAGARPDHGRARATARWSIVDVGCRRTSWCGAWRAAGSARTAGRTRTRSAPRQTCRKCGGQLVQRTDDNQEVVLERLKVYQQATRPVLEFYRERPTFRVVNGAQAPERGRARARRDDRRRQRGERRA